MTTPKTKPVPTAAMVEIAQWLNTRLRQDVLLRQNDSVESIAQALADIDAEAYARGRADEREACAAAADEQYRRWSERYRLYGAAVDSRAAETARAIASAIRGAKVKP